MSAEPKYSSSSPVTLALGDKQITLYTAKCAQAPIVYLNTAYDEGESVFARCTADVHLAIIGNVDWNDEMSPWPIPAISDDDMPCTGGADAYLRRMLDTIVPGVEDALEREQGKTPSFRVLAGYSLAGLFALYALYKTDVFSRIASMSGSLWYPHLIDYLETHRLYALPDKVYFSLGKEESHTDNPYLMSVAERTEQIVQLYLSEGITALYRHEPGGHYESPGEVARRIAAGIDWITA